VDWFRWHHGSVTDPKFQLVARKAGASLADVLAVWAYILEQASASEDRGQFGSIDCEAVDCMFGFPSTETRTLDIITAMRGRGLLESDRVAAWDKRQPKREREGDKSTERVRAFRERQSHETPRNATERQETPRGEERREEQIPSEPKGSGAVAPADVIFALGVPLLTAAAVAEKNARSMLGLMRKMHGDEAVIDAIERCAAERPLQPVEWLQGALKRHKAQAPPKSHVSAEETKAMLDRQSAPLTAEEKAKADEARARAMQVVRRVA